MVSVLGNYYYDFPKEIPLKLRLKDMLESKVDEKYYISNTKIKKIITSNFAQEKAIIQTTDICGTILARDYKDPKCVPINSSEPKCEQVAQLTGTGYTEMTGRIYSDNGLCPTIRTMQGGNLEPKIAEPICINSKVDGKQPRVQDRIYDTGGTSTAITTGFMPSIAEPICINSKVDGKQLVNYRVRKLTPKECWRLMGFDDSDFDKAKASGVSNSQLYKQAGNSIVVDVLMAIFKEIL